MAERVTIDPFGPEVDAFIAYHYTREELEDMLEHYGETDEQIIRIEPENYIENVT